MTKPVTCKECVMGSPIYIPCGKPAVCMIHWPGRSDPPLPMCEWCADHNTHNRGAARKPLEEKPTNASPK